MGAATQGAVPGETFLWQPFRENHLQGSHVGPRPAAGGVTGPQQPATPSPASPLRPRPRVPDGGRPAAGAAGEPPAGQPQPVRGIHVHGGGIGRCSCEGRSGPPGSSRPAAAGRGGWACRVGGGRGAQGARRGGGGAGRAHGAWVGASGPAGMRVGAPPQGRAVLKLRGGRARR